MIDFEFKKTKSKSRALSASSSGALRNGRLKRYIENKEYEELMDEKDI